MARPVLTADRQHLLVRLGENIRRERLALGMTQETLAELGDLHVRVVQKVESGQTNIIATTLIRLQAALGCPWERLMPPPSPRKGAIKTPARRVRH